MPQIISESQAAEILSSKISVKAALPTIEIKEIQDVFGVLYTLRVGGKLAGTFYETLSGEWVAQPYGSLARPCFCTPEQAQIKIVSLYLRRNQAA